MINLNTQGATMKPRKYRNVPTVVEGFRFDSKAEAKRYRELCLLERAGQINQLGLQTPFRLTVAGQLICKYVADFVYLEAGMQVVEDVKGVRTDAYRLKRKLMKACYGIEIREITNSARR